LVRIRSGSAETEKTGRFSRHRETPRRISALQDHLSTSFFSLSTYATETSSVASRGQKMPGTAGKNLSSCSIWRRKTKTGRTLCRTVVARVSVGSLQWGGRAWKGGVRRVRPEHTAGNNAHPPPLSTDMLFWSPLCPARGYVFVFYLFCEDRATIAAAFRGTVSAYYCIKTAPHLHLQ